MSLGGRLEAVTSLDTPGAPLQLEHVVGAARLLVGGTHGWPGHAADQRALARGLQREQEVYPRPCIACACTDSALPLHPLTCNDVTLSTA